MQGCTIQSYGAGQATIAGGTSPAILITECDGITISNLALTNSSTSNSTNVYTGVLNMVENTSLRYTNGVTITGCSISGGPNGITSQCKGGNSGGWNSITISNNTIFNCSEFGVYLHEVAGGTTLHHSNVQITGNTVYNITGDSNSHGASGCGIVLGNADDTTGTGAAQCVISYNLVYSCGASSTQSAGPAGIFPIYCTNVLVKYNVCHDISMSSANSDGDGIDVDLGCTGCIVEYNYTYNNGGPGYNFYNQDSGTVYRWNLSVNDNQTNPHAGSMMVGPEAGNPTVSIYNNTFISTGSYPAVQMQGTIENVKLYNNIIVSASSVPGVYIQTAIGTGNDFQGNAYLSGSSGFLCKIASTTYSSLAAWRTATSLETSPHGFNVPIGFVGPSGVEAILPTQLASLHHYQLLLGTLAFAGLNLNSLYSINPGTVDLLGATLTSPYSVGAINAPSLVILGDQIQEAFG